MLTKEQKDQIIKDYQTKEGDTGSPEVQIALLTFRIKELTEHMKKNPKDHSSRRGLFKLISRRKGLLNYVKNEDINRYRELIERLGIRG